VRVGRLNHHEKGKIIESKRNIVESQYSFKESRQIGKKKHER